MSNSMTQYNAYLAQCEKDSEEGLPFSEWFSLDTDSYAKVIADIKALDGCIFATLTPDEKSLLKFFQERGRKYDIAISIVNLASPEELMKATSKEAADQILSAANSKVGVIHRPQNAIKAVNGDGEIRSIDPFSGDGKQFSVVGVAGVGAYNGASGLLNEITAALQPLYVVPFSDA